MKIVQYQTVQNKIVQYELIQHENNATLNCLILK